MCCGAHGQPCDDAPFVAGQPHAGPQPPVQTAPAGRCLQTHRVIGGSVATLDHDFPSNAWYFPDSNQSVPTCLPSRNKAACSSSSCFQAYMLRSTGGVTGAAGVTVGVVPADANARATRACNSVAGSAQRVAPTNENAAKRTRKRRFMLDITPIERRRCGSHADSCWRANPRLANRGHDPSMIHNANAAPGEKVIASCRESVRNRLVKGREQGRRGTVIPDCDAMIFAFELRWPTARHIPAVAVSSPAG